MSLPRLALLLLLACKKEAPPPPPSAAPPPPPMEGAVDVAVPAAVLVAPPSLGPVPADGLRVRTPGTRGWTSVEVTCPSGFRTRFSLDPEGDSVSASGGVAGLPAEDCRLFFKGAGPVQYGPVRPGVALSCSFAGTTALCRPERNAEGAATGKGGGLPISVRYSGPSAAAIEVVCADGQKVSAALIQNAATLDGIRPGSACRLRLLGARRYEWGPVAPGMELVCRESRGRLDCADGAAVVAPKPLAPLATDTLEVEVQAAPGATALEVVCPSGHRSRVPLTDRGAVPPAAFAPARLRGLPAEDCVLYWKGGPPARYAPVRGGSALSCTVSGITASCLPAAR